MPLLIILAILGVMGGCAKDKYFDRDKSNPAYYEGAAIPLTDKAGIGVAQKDPNRLPPPTKDEGPGALIASGMAWAAYPDYYKSSAIHGHCEIQDDSSFVKLPCRRLSVVLYDNTDRELGRANTTDQGEFAFHVAKNKTYKVAVTDPRFEMINPPQNLVMGNEIWLRLKRAGKK